MAATRLFVLTTNVWCITSMSRSPGWYLVDRVLSGVLEGHSRGTPRVLTSMSQRALVVHVRAGLSVGYSRGTRGVRLRVLDGVLEGYSQETVEVLEGYSQETIEVLEGVLPHKNLGIARKRSHSASRDALGVLQGTPSLLKVLTG